MAEVSYKDEIIQEVDKLDAERQRQVLDFVRSLSGRPRGTPGWLAAQYAREFGFTAQDLAEMEAAIEDCERIDWDEWDLPTGH